MLEPSLQEDQPVINLLESHVIDQIAAGEVVERPASIVKELVENSVDGGATSIQVDIEGGGLGRMTVTDDGVGMGPEDLRRCWQRHATSKLLNPSDLFCIDTFGFRGEALSSIASVSEIAITTRRKRDHSGLEMRIKGGKLVAETTVGCPQGTSVDIQHLFYNTPARRKFLRSPATEQAHVVDACLRTAMGSRRVGLVLTSGRRRLVDIPSDSRGRERIELALGKRVGALCDFEYSADGIRVSGFRSGLEVDRGDAKGIWIFVNGRYVRDKMLQRAVLDAFRGMVQRGRYPIVVLFVDIHPETIDVNVHPQKLEVRFSEAAPVYRALASALAVSEEQVPLPTRKLEQRRVDTQDATLRYMASASNNRHQGKAKSLEGPSSPPTYGANTGTASSLPKPAQAVVEPVVAIGHDLDPSPEATYGYDWVRPWDDVIGVCVDDEFLFYSPTVAYQELVYRDLMDTEDVEPRSLMLPYPFHTSVDDTASLELHQALLGRLGARVEEVGPNRFLVRSLPALLGDMNCEQWVRLTLPCLRSGHENEDIRAALLRAWVGLVERRDGPLAVNDIRRLLELDANKAKGVQGYYRYGVTKKVTYDEVVQKTSPKRL